MSCLNRLALAAVAVTTAIGLASSVAADAQTLTRLYLSKDKSQLVDLLARLEAVLTRMPDMATSHG